MTQILHQQLQKEKNEKSREKSRASPGGSVIKKPSADATEVRV